MSNPNYAPNPKKQQVYRNLQNKKLSNVTAKDIQQLTDPTFIQATNQDALITYNMLNQAMFRDGGPIPGTTQALYFEKADSDGYATFEYTPGLGEVVVLTGIQMESTGGSTRSRVQVHLNDTSGSGRVVELGDETVSSTTSPYDPVGQFNGSIYLDNNCTLKVYFSSMTTGETGSTTIIKTRVR